MVKAYYQLTKPGIIYGNLLSLVAGFFFASSLTHYFDVWLFLLTNVGTALVIGSACVYNNVMDRGLDKHMARTKKRALVVGEISVKRALLFGGVLGILGFAILWFATNTVTVLVGVVGFLDYLVLYAFSKRRSIFGTLVGSIAGAMPIVAGFTAVTGNFDQAAFILFLIMAAWQMPHFYAISLYRFDDYKAAGLPVWPVKKGAKSTKLQMLLFIMAFLAASLALSIYSYTGLIYTFVMSVVSLLWLWRGIEGFEAKDTARWAKKLFGMSLLVLLVFCSVLSVGALLP